MCKRAVDILHNCVIMNRLSCFTAEPITVKHAYSNSTTGECFARKSYCFLNGSEWHGVNTQHHKSERHRLIGTSVQMIVSTQQYVFNVCPAAFNWL